MGGKKTQSSGGNGEVVSLQSLEQIKTLFEIAKKKFPYQKFAHHGEIKQALIKEKLDKWEEEFRQSEAYSRACAKGYALEALRFAQATASIQAQAIIYSRYPSFGKNGEPINAKIGARPEATPHIQGIGESLKYINDMIDKAIQRTEIKIEWEPVREYFLNLQLE